MTMLDEAPAPPSVSKHEQLEEVYTEYQLDPAFDHLRGDAAFVPGVGNPHGRLTVIGEAPGRMEDREGEPFIGPSGRLLNELLWEQGLRRAEVWVTNVIKYRPPDNRTPTDDEVACARPYLRREIAVLGAGRARPTVLLLGRTALNLVVPGSSVGAMRGKVIERARWRYVPTYHPAAALRNSLLRERIREDFKVMRKVMG